MTAAHATSDPGLDYGEVFTRRWVVEHILDLVEYTPDNDLGTVHLVEPSCGTGAFLCPQVIGLVGTVHHQILDWPLRPAWWQTPSRT